MGDEVDVQIAGLGCGFMQYVDYRAGLVWTG